MELPQEIVDEIVAYVAISLNAVARSRGLHRKPAVVDKNSLKACALTSRSFLPRSQKRLFASVICKAELDVFSFDRLLFCSPHLGSYVEWFVFRRALEAIFEQCITRILRLLPNLDHLLAKSFDRNGYHPPVLTTAFQAASPSRLRILCLCDTAFADAAELESTPLARKN
ncbi:hypothetical protein C8J57DRAFT_566937 [Mycena rebaudengoi]|nr:hypothetical protein C8J57DRAFT_566937 [Mycena rebaudengoi]